MTERIKDIESSAAALYDGGWRATDRDELIEEYDLDPADADAICNYLQQYQENAAAEENENKNKKFAVFLMRCGCTPEESGRIQEAYGLPKKDADEICAEIKRLWAYPENLNQGELKAYCDHLYDAGYRRENEQEIQAAYNLTDAGTAAVCAMLEEIEVDGPYRFTREGLIEFDKRRGYLDSKYHYNQKDVAAARERLYYGNLRTDKDGFVIDGTVYPETDGNFSWYCFAAANTPEGLKPIGSDVKIGGKVYPFYELAGAYITSTPVHKPIWLSFDVEAILPEFVQWYMTDTKPNANDSWFYELFQWFDENGYSGKW
jgi:predicted transcriptional regulator